MKPGQLVRFAFAALAAFAVYTFVSVAGEAESRRSCVPLCAMRPSYAGQNRLAPDFELTSLEGQRVKLASFRGKTVILNFWTKTCRPCLEEMPSISDLAKVLAKRTDVVVLTVTTDEDPNDIRQTLQAVLGEAPQFRVLIDVDAQVVRERYGTTLFPETWVIDDQGIIRARFDGAKDWSNPLLLDLVDSLRRPASCDVEFHAGVPSGLHAPICEESGAAG